MKEFFHYTDPELAGSILETGLLPGAAVDRAHYYCGVLNDNSRIYLIKGLGKAGQYRRTVRHRTRLLRVMLEDDHPVDRAFEQFLVYLRVPENALSRYLSSLGLSSPPSTREGLFRYFMELYGLGFEGPATRENVSRHLRMISDKRWDEQSPCYATEKPIPPSQIELLP